MGEKLQRTRGPVKLNEQIHIQVGVVLRANWLQSMAVRSKKDLPIFLRANCHRSSSGGPVQLNEQIHIQVGVVEAPKKAQEEYLQLH